MHNITGGNNDAERKTELWITGSSRCCCRVTDWFFRAVAADKVVVIPLMRSAAGIIHNGVRYGTVTSQGKTWLDRNLGAARVATSSADEYAYGSLYQWGRGADGHENRTSPTTATLSTTDTPGHGSFITPSSLPYDWHTPQNGNLWQGASGINNPCPSGFRLPTDTELDAERSSWSSQDAAGAYGSPLKLVVAGYRDRYNGSIDRAGSIGYYWSGTVNGAGSRSLYFDSGFANMNSYNRAYGFSVRCLKD